jgi:hypothetical protein
MNIDYKYFAGSKDPINIINKYRMRGFGVYLNEPEVETYIKYCHAVPFWNNLFKINPLSKRSYEACLGPCGINYNIFKPRLKNKDLINNQKIKPLDTNDYEMGVNDHIMLNSIFTVRRYNSIEMFNTMKDYKYINSDTGYIEPFKSNIIDMVYHLYPLKEDFNNIIIIDDNKDDTKKEENNPNDDWTLPTVDWNNTNELNV